MACQHLKVEKTYGDIFKRAEVEFSGWNFDQADTEMLLAISGMLKECGRLLALDIPLALPAYDQCMKASHLFNMLDARGVISVTERAAYIGRVLEFSKRLL